MKTRANQKTKPGLWYDLTSDEAESLENQGSLAVEAAKRRWRLRVAAEINFYDKRGFLIARLNVSRDSKTSAVGKPKEVLSGLRVLERSIPETRIRMLGHLKKED